MNSFFYNHRKKIPFVGVFLLILGIIVAYFKWGFEPEETIAGVLCGLGLSLTIIGFGIKKPTKI
ncbi:MAG: hypothetical protein ABJH82_11010 [Polaribacter sp.]|uniref:hypothetical protein n=1 Tax=Polaribacter sp. TaxID=1920175 RepID=UPI003263E77D